MTKRPTLEQTLMETARAWARRSTCPDLAVGCVLATRGGHVQATGYNGAPRGMPHCEPVQVHMRASSGMDSDFNYLPREVAESLTTGPFTVCKDNYYKQEHRVVHAEANAVAQAARLGASLQGSTAWVTHAPCWKCAALLLQAGVVRVAFEEGRVEKWMTEMPVQFGYAPARQST